MTKHKFAIYHVPPARSLADQGEVGRVFISAVRGSRPNGGHGARPARKSRRGVKYAAIDGARMVLPRDAAPKIDGFPLRFNTSDGTKYVQRDGIRYRLDKLIASGRVQVQPA
jgi:hypothetical protein